MEDFYGQPSSPEHAICSIDGGVDSPPSYDADALLQSSPLRRKFNVQPREDEGREILPPYSSEISLEHVFSRKMELEGAVHRAHDRNWYRVYVTLQGTALTFHKYKSSGYFSAWSSEGGRTDVAVPGKKGHFLKSYNLQHADVGIAADYYKYALLLPRTLKVIFADSEHRKKYVIRLRAETDQFLLSCFKIETFLHWLQSLFAAIDIAPPLDTRSLPRDFSIPRARRRRATCSTSFTDVERNAALVREQFEIMRQQYPRLVDAAIPEDPERQSTETPTEQAQRPATSRPGSVLTLQRPSSSNDITPIPTNSSRLSRLQTQSTTALSQPPRLSHQPSTSSSTISEAHPSISPETGKWRPEHQWSAMYDMMYAKRCMAILTSRSPRKSNLVIMKGKQWVVDWATGAFTRCEPPDYGECIGEVGKGGHILDAAVERQEFGGVAVGEG